MSKECKSDIVWNISFLKSDIFAKLRPSPSQIQFQFRAMITPILILSSNPAWPPDPQGQKIFTK